METMKTQWEPIFSFDCLPSPASVSGWCQCVCQLLLSGRIVQSDPGFLSCGFKWCGEPAGDVQGLKKCFRRPHSDRRSCTHSYTQAHTKSMKTCTEQLIQTDEMHMHEFRFSNIHLYLHDSKEQNRQITLS